MLSDDGKESNTAKGINIASYFNEFEDTLVNKKVVRHKMKITQSKKIKLRAYEIKKILLSSFDGKRFVLIDGIHTLAFLHKGIVSHG